MINLQELLIKKLISEDISVIQECILYEVIGKDAQTFLQGQLTSDVKKLLENKFHLTARVDRSGRIRFHGIIACNNNQSYSLFVPSFYKFSAQTELEKYIISESVEIFDKGLKNISLTNLNQVLDSWSGNFLNFPFFMSIYDRDSNYDKKVNQDNIQSMSILLGVDFFESKADTILNESTLIKDVYSTSKGCFLGQETIAKIEINRGASKYPALLVYDDNQTIADNEQILKIENFIFQKKILPREVRNKSTYSDEGTGHTSHLYNYPHKEFDVPEKVKDFFLNFCVNLFLSNSEKASIEFKRLYDLFSDYPDVVEAYSSFLMNTGNLIKALEIAQRLVEKFPSLPMGHTLKSIIFMRQGKIPEAEEEKAKSLSISFGNNGNSNLLINSSNSKEVEKKRSLYEQVLAIDPEDQMALYGMLETSIELQINDYAIWLKSIFEYEKINKAKLNVIIPKLKKNLGLIGLKDIFSELREVSSKQKDLISELTKNHLDG